MASQALLLIEILYLKACRFFLQAFCWQCKKSYLFIECAVSSKYSKN